MEGINLSQSMQESRKGSSEEKRTLLDTGMMVAFAVFIVAAMIWGGLAWYVSTVDQKIAAANTELAASVASLASEKADRVGDFSDRSAIIYKSLGGAADPSAELGRIEAAVVPGVVLTGYQYDKETGTISIVGITDNFKFIAQQLLVFKVSDGFVVPKVALIERTKEGKIEFTLETGLPMATAAVSAQ